MNPETPIRDLLQRVKERLEVLYGDRLAGLYLYGSYARGDAHDESDIDLLAVLQGEIDSWEEGNRLVDTLHDLEIETSTVISVYPVSSERYANVDAPLIRNVLREGVAV